MPSQARKCYLKKPKITEHGRGFHIPIDGHPQCVFLVKSHFLKFWIMLHENQKINQTNLSAFDGSLSYEADYFSVELSPTIVIDKTLNN